jgi:putative peptidoglycan lipid II flippase
VALLFQRGSFDAHTVRLTSAALLYYALGLWAFSAVRIVVSMFYALQDTRTPVVTATISIAANILLGMALMGPLKHCGLALATSLASIVNLALMVSVLGKKIGMLPWPSIFTSCLKTLVASAIMALAVLLIRQLPVFGPSPPEGLRLLAMTGLCIGGGVAVFSVAANLLNIEQWHQVMGLVQRSLGRA